MSKSKKEVQIAWSKVAEHNVEEHLIYNIIRKLPYDRGFTKIVRPKKIISFSNDEWNGLNQAIYAISNKFNSKSWMYNEKYIQKMEVLFGTKFDEDIIKTLSSLEFKK